MPPNNPASTSSPGSISVESILTAVTKISTFNGTTNLTSATGFFFERDQRLFVVTNRHVVINEPTAHRPDRIELEIHINPENIAQVSNYSIPLYKNSKAVWSEIADAGGSVDIVAIEINRQALPNSIVFTAFNEHNLPEQLESIEVGTTLLIVGFPLGFHDTLHKLPVARHAIISSAFGLRFQGQGYFLTDARLHRGTSGAPVVARSTRRSGRNQLPFLLLGVHGARLDVNRNEFEDERLALNVAWYSNVLMALTSAPVNPQSTSEKTENPVSQAQPSSSVKSPLPPDQTTAKGLKSVT